MSLIEALLADDEQKMPGDLRELARAVAGSAFPGSKPMESVQAASNAEKITALYKALVENNNGFDVGQLVVWKKGLKNRRFPAYGEPVVVLQHIQSAVANTTESGQPTFYEPLDVKLAIIASDGDFDAWAFDSRRFEPYVPPAAIHTS